MAEVDNGLVPHGKGVSVPTRKAGAGTKGLRELSA